MIKINWKELSISFEKKTLVGESVKTESLPTWTIPVFVVITLISIGSWILYYMNGLTLSYNDARSHLDVARRVVDSLTPGITQIGSVWLPLQHILELPTIWNEALFRTGLSGSLISMLAFIGSAYFLFKISRLFKLDYYATILVLLTFVLNPNMLFLQSIPMTESLLLFTLLGASYYFIKWGMNNSINSIIGCGIFTFLAVLTRYDGWALLLFIATGIFIISYIKNSYKKAEGDLALYAYLGFFAMALWFGWNWLIFGDPLFFMTSQYSAQAQQDIISSHGLLLTKHNLPYSIEVYGLAIVANMSILVSILGGLGILKSLLFNTKLTTKILIITFLIPVGFNIISLYLGQSVINLPQLFPYTWFNIRYGIMALPAIALGAGFLTNKRKLATILAAVIILFQYGSMYATNSIVTVQDGVRGSSGYFLDDVGKWVHTNAANGLILIPASSSDSLIFISGLPLNHFITEGSGKYWKMSLDDPTVYASFVIMHEGDLVYNKVHNNPKFTKNYSLVYQGSFSNIYEKNSLIYKSN